jgi:hypothetical protein
LPLGWPSSRYRIASGASIKGYVVGQGCDDQFEFEFALDLVLDGLERLKDRS